MKLTLVPIFISAVLVLGGCKKKCVDAPVSKAFLNVDATTLEALSRAKGAQTARMCDEVEGKGGREPPALVFSGGMPTAWRAIEDELRKAGWERYDQGKTPTTKDTVFSVTYKRNGDWKSLFVMFIWNGSCPFGDVCVRGHVS